MKPGLVRAFSLSTHSSVPHLSAPYGAFGSVPPNGPATWSTRVGGRFLWRETGIAATRMVRRARRHPPLTCTCFGIVAWLWALGCPRLAITPVRHLYSLRSRFPGWQLSILAGRIDSFSPGPILLFSVSNFFFLRNFRERTSPRLASGQVKGYPFPRPVGTGATPIFDYVGSRGGVQRQ